MEGGLLVHAAWMLSAVFVWVYQRWFEKVADRYPDFERFCEGRPVVAVLALVPNAEARALAILAQQLPRGETVATLGVWPWIHYALRVECTSRPGTLLITITGCRLLRTRELPPCALGTALREVQKGLAADLLDSWLHPDACVDLSGRVQAEHGWRLDEAKGVKVAFAPCDARPEFVSRFATPKTT